MGVQYTRKITEHCGQPYLLKQLDELNILADAMENHLGMCYTAHLVKFHCHHESSNAVCKPIVDIYFLRLQPIRKKYRRFDEVQRMRVSGKKQVGTKNKWLIIINRLPEGKE